MRALRLFAALACAFASAHVAQAAEAEPSFDFLYEEARVYVPVRIDGSEPLWFILDTGATPTIIDAAVARRLHLPTHGDTAVQGAGSGTSRQSQASPVRLTIGATTMEVAQPAVADLVGLLASTSGRVPAGLVGSQFFREHVVELDFERNRVALFAPETDRSARFEQSIAIDVSSGVPMTGATLALPSGRRVSMKVMVDLGAKSTLLVAEPFIARERLDDAFPVKVTTLFGAGVGGDTSYAFGRAMSLALDRDPRSAIADPVVGLSVGGTIRSTGFDALLGAEYLARFRVAFDYGASRLLMSPTHGPAPGFDRSGMFIVALDTGVEHLVVRQVLAGGPAAEAGIQPGDEIVSLDGRAASALRLPGARALLKEDRRVPVSVVHARDGRAMQASLRLRDLL